MPKPRPKIRGKKNVYDEWEHADIDRDEQKAGLERRARRWKEIELAKERQRHLEQVALDAAGNVRKDTKAREPTELEYAWLRCDFILSHIMEPNAYYFMEQQRINDSDTYKRLYRKFVSPNMMLHMQDYVDYFAKGGKPPKAIPLGLVVQYYKKIKGIKTKFIIKHKGEEEEEI